MQDINTPLVMMRIKKKLVWMMAAVVFPSTSVMAGFVEPVRADPPAVVALNTDEQVRIALYEKVSPAVVTLKVGQGSGSGSIISADGLVLTNEHVVRQASRGRVEVLTAGGERYVGVVIAVERRQDLALVQIVSSQRFPTVPLNTSNSTQVGQQVYAIGSPFGLSGTLTTGILSRIAPNGDLQTDAAINQGNSGGPLLNSQGVLIGVNKAIVTPNRGNVGIGFATAVGSVKRFLGQQQDAIAQAATLARQARTPSRPQPQASPRPVEPRPQLGIEITPDLIVRGVERGSIASRIGLQPGDRLIAIDRQRIRSVRDLQQFMAGEPDQALLTIARYRRLLTVRVNFTAS